MYTPRVPAKGLHPFEGFSTVITHKVFPLSMDGLVSVEGAGCDKGLSADFTSVRPFPCVCPNVSCQVGAVTEALLTHRAAVGPVFILLHIVLIEMKGQRRVL